MDATWLRDRASTSDRAKASRTAPSGATTAAGSAIALRSMRRRMSASSMRCADSSGGCQNQRSRCGQPRTSASTSRPPIADDLASVTATKRDASEAQADRALSARPTASSMPSLVPAILPSATSAMLRKEICERQHHQARLTHRCRTVCEYRRVVHDLADGAEHALFALRCCAICVRQRLIRPLRANNPRQQDNGLAGRLG